MTNSESERPIPVDGTAILLYEKSEGSRTYSDHDNVVGALEKLLDIFEALREKEGLDTKHYTLRDIHVWLHSFYDIQMMVYDKEINRYKRIDAKHLEALLHDQVQAALNQV